MAHHAGRAPWIVWVGLAVVLAAAAVLSFDVLRGLAEAVSVPPRLSWLLPIAVDAGAAVSTACWLSNHVPRDASRFAARMTWALLLVTVLGNAGQLGMHAHGITPPWWVAVLVGTIPPAVVGSTVHLLVLLVRGPSAADRKPEAQAKRKPQTRRSKVAIAPLPSADDTALVSQLRDWADQEGSMPSREKVRVRFGIGTKRADRIRKAALNGQAA